ncbi:MAG: hypothetical protein IT377_31130 [Polyangiaceae bacterium]|nr:hypothetical protein [Polyangiaceae bacterium]
MRSLLFLLGALAAVGAATACGGDDDSKPAGSGGSASGGTAGTGGATGGSAGSSGSGGSGTGGSSGSGGGTAKLEIAPINEVLIVDAAKTPVEASAVYSAKLEGKDATPNTVFTVPAAYGSFVGALFTSASSLPGLAVSATTQVQATSGGASGSTKLSLIRLEASGSLGKPFVILPYGSAAKTLKTVVAVTPTFGSPKDITLTLANNTGNGVTDATKLVITVEAMAKGDSVLGCASGSVKDAVGNDGVPDIFVGGPVGQTLCFEITFKDNAYVFPEAEVRSLVLDAIAVGYPGAVKAPAVPVYVFVPPKP